MRKISEYRGTEAVELLANLIEPASKIVATPKLKQAVKNGATQAEIAKIAMNANAQAVVEVLAVLNGADPKKYNPNAFEILQGFIEAMNDEALIGFFHSQAQMKASNSSTSASTNTKGKQ